MPLKYTSQGYKNQPTLPRTKSKPYITARRKTFYRLYEQKFYPTRSRIVDFLILI